MENFQKVADVVVAILKAVAKLLENIGQKKAQGIVEEVGKNVEDVVEIIVE